MLTHLLMNQKKKKKERNTIVDSYGYVRWDPPFPINETDESLKNKKKLLKENNRQSK